MNPDKVIALDIETGPLPLEQLKRMTPKFEAPSNYKDPEKIQKAIWDQEAKWIEKAALSPMTGQLLAFGYKIRGSGIQVWCQDEKGFVAEKDLIEVFWEEYRQLTMQGYCFAGSNLIGFDFQFLKIRSHILGIELPPNITWARYGTEAGTFDIQDWWNFCPGQNRDKTGLDAISKALGFAGKNGDGTLFHQMFKDDPEAAIQYLENDIEMTRKVIDVICPKTKPRVDA